MSDDTHNRDTQPKRSKAYDAYAVKNGKDGKGYFNRIGAAFAHRDGKGFDIDMAATPVNGRVTLREPKDRLDEVRGGNRNRSRIVWSSKQARTQAGRVSTILITQTSGTSAQ